MDTLFDVKQLSTDELEAGMADVLASPKSEGTLRLIVQRPNVNARRVMEVGALTETDGLVGDNWKTKGSKWRRGGDPKRQITVMNWRFARLVAAEEERIALAGDQLYVDLDLGKENLPPGTRIAIGEEAVIEVTAPPHLGCKKFVARFGMDAMMFANSEFGRLNNLRGINAKVVNDGNISAGDPVIVISA